MFDDDANGAIDRVDATFDETLETSGADTTTGWTTNQRPGGINNVSAVGVTGSTASLTFTGGSAGADSAAVGNFTVTLNSGTGQIRDAAGNKAGFSGESPTDEAGPVPRLLDDSDGSSNGTFQTNDTLTVAVHGGHLQRTYDVPRKRRRHPARWRERRQ